MAFVLVFMFCAPKLVFGGTEGVRSRFRRNRGCRLPFSCFALLDLFLAVRMASVLVFMFCAPELVFDGSEGVRSCFHILRPQTRFRRYRGHRVPFSYFALPDSFSAVPRASGLIFMFCVAGLVFGGKEGVGSHFHVLRSRTIFRRYRGRWVPFSYFALPDSFSAVLGASGSVFMFCAPGLIFGCTKVVGSRFHFLCSQTRFGRYRGRRVLFSCYARPNSLSAVPRASVPVFIFYAPGLVLGGTEGVESRFHVLRARTRFRRYQVRMFPFSCFARSD
jgi:hypothetical protein